MHGVYSILGSIASSLSAGKFIKLDRNNVAKSKRTKHNHLSSVSAEKENEKIQSSSFFHALAWIKYSEQK